jgi:hypothetical protein
MVLECLRRDGNGTPVSVMMAVEMMAVDGCWRTTGLMVLNTSIFGYFEGFVVGILT